MLYRACFGAFQDGGKRRRPPLPGLPPNFYKRRDYLSNLSGFNRFYLVLTVLPHWYKTSRPYLVPSVTPNLWSLN